MTNVFTIIADKFTFAAGHPDPGQERGYGRVQKEWINESAKVVADLGGEGRVNCSSGWDSAQVLDGHERTRVTEGYNCALFYGNYWLVFLFVPTPTTSIVVLAKIRPVFAST